MSLLDTPPLADSAAALPVTARSARLTSLDVFRGMTIAAMLLVNDPGKGKAYAPLEHAEWHGWTPTDLIFPFFLFIVGVAIPFSNAKRAASAPTSRGAMLRRVWVRALALVLLGALLTGFTYSGVALTLGHRGPSVPLFTLGADVPDGFRLLKTLRAVAWTFIGVAIIALLIPYRSAKWQTRMPLAVAAILALLVAGVALANHYAWAHGLPADANLGGGIFRPDRYRIPGVLQRIGICYGVAATLSLFMGWRGLLASLLVLLATYSVLMLRVPFPDHEKGPLTKEANLARWVDETVFDRYTTAPDGQRTTVWKHTYGPYPDPEGLLSTLPAVGTVLVGILCGLWLRSSRPAVDRCAGLLALGVPVTILGAVLGHTLMQINKQIWTPSFVVFCGGLAMLGLGATFWLVDVHGRRRWAWPFVVYGTNAIAAFVAAGLLVRVGLIIKVAKPDGTTRSLLTIAQDSMADLVHRLPPALATPQNTSLAYALLFVLIVFAPMAVLYACRIFIKV